MVSTGVKLAAGDKSPRAAELVRARESSGQVSDTPHLTFSPFPSSAVSLDRAFPQGSVKTPISGQ